MSGVILMSFTSTRQVELFLWRLLQHDEWGYSHVVYFNTTSGIILMAVTSARWVGLFLMSFTSTRQVESFLWRLGPTSTRQEESFLWRLLQHDGWSYYYGLPGFRTERPWDPGSEPHCMAAQSGGTCVLRLHYIIGPTGSIMNMMMIMVVTSAASREGTQV